MEYFSGNAQLRMSVGSFENSSFPGNHSAAPPVPNVSITPAQYHQSMYAPHPAGHISTANNAPVQSTLHEDVDPMMILAGSHENSAPIYFDFNPNPVSSAAQREIDSYLGLDVGSSNSRHNSLLFEPARKSIDEMDVSPSQYMGSPQILPSMATASAPHFLPSSSSSSSTAMSAVHPSSVSISSTLSRNVMQRRVGNQPAVVSAASSSTVAPSASVMRLYEIDMPTSQEVGSFPKAGSYKEYQGLLDSELDMHLDRCV